MVNEKLANSRALAERVLKSRGLSVALCLLWGGLTAHRARSLIGHFDWLESCWVLYNAVIAILFLIRTRPTVVSLHPLHWLVALVTSFSGLFFGRSLEAPGPSQLIAADTLIALGLALGVATAIMLGRSYDFLPALRGVQTGWLYAFVRHPMYLSSILIRLGYVVRNCTLPNLVVFVAMTWLYDRRARYEEAVMQNDEAYRRYLARVRSRFVPLLY
jgi:protein-S-isoprenylcysteine O-methyltransferase Ste14